MSQAVCESCGKELPYQSQAHKAIDLEIPITSCYSFCSKKCLMDYTTKEKQKKVKK